MVQNVVQHRPMREGLVEIHGSEPGCSIEMLGVSQEMCGSDPGQAQTDTGVCRGTAAPSFWP